MICADLRADGRIGIPTSKDDHFPYSKCAMAEEFPDRVTDLSGFLKIVPASVGEIRDSDTRSIDEFGCVRRHLWTQILESDPTFFIVSHLC